MFFLGLNIDFLERLAAGATVEVAETLLAAEDCSDDFMRIDLRALEVGETYGVE